jgi:DNA (cytosine-5)-methyltransferase 1
MQAKEIPGCPDFYFPSRKAALFVDGCFWHGCKKCFQMPDTNKKFWALKIKTNIARDRTVNKLLTDKGITAIRIKEHELKDPHRVLNKIEREFKKVATPKVLDLFAGAGGLSEGFVRAGCEIVGHIEMDRNACETLITRTLYHALVRRGKLNEYKKYIFGKTTRDGLIEKYKLQKEKNSVMCAKIGEDNYKKLIREVKKRLNRKKLDIIIGGPPCQAYSYIGRARDDKNMRHDKRNFLYRYYVEFLKTLKPKIFVFENVPGLETAGKGKYLRDMQKLMKSAGYDTDYKILNAVDFGVPQNRKRIILIGWNKKSKLKSYPDFPSVKRTYLVKDFFVGLPKIKAGIKYPIKKLKGNVLLEKLGIFDPKFGILMDHAARPNTKQDLEIYRHAVLEKQKGKNIKYNLLPKHLKTHNNENVFLDRFKVINITNKGSHTIVAHIAKDGHFYIHPDIKQNRSLTVREAARLQTFPDSYKFEGERGPQFRQIGNAVPPMFAEIVASTILRNI